VTPSLPVLNPGSNQSPADSHIRKEQKGVCPHPNRPWVSLKQVGSMTTVFIAVNKPSGSVKWLLIVIHSIFFLNNILLFFFFKAKDYLKTDIINPSYILPSHTTVYNSALCPHTNWVFYMTSWNNQRNVPPPSPRLVVTTRKGSEYDFRHFVKTVFPSTFVHHSDIWSVTNSTVLKMGCKYLYPNFFSKHPFVIIYQIN